jgi:hypothetical protein
MSACVPIAADVHVDYKHIFDTEATNMRARYRLIVPTNDEFRTTGLYCTYPDNIGLSVSAAQSFVLIIYR